MGSSLTRPPRSGRWRLGHARAAAAALAAVVASAACGPLVAQSPAGARARLPVAAELFTGGELEGYLRTLQLVGTVAPYPVSLRGYSRAEVDSLRPRRSHPWAMRYDLGDADGVTGRRSTGDGAIAVIRPSLAARWNSTFPFGGNDGAVWAGRGLTTSVQAGVAVRLGPVSLTLAPIAFRAENAGFPLRPNGFDDRLRFADGTFPTVVDRPQRFGDGAYQRIDPGQSTLRLDALGAAVGVSTANLLWGPAAHYPFLLGTNAPGFTHVFAGTARPARIGIGQLHGRVIWGRLEQSGWFDPARAGNPLTRPGRFATGLLLLFEPAALPGLEVGGARFFHAPWPDRGLPGRYVWRSFQAVTKESLPEVPEPIPGDRFSQDGENQLASVFARWAFPRSGFELYAEFGREDHSGDLRDLMLEPDHIASVLWGVRKVWTRRDASLVALRVESLNFERNDPSGARRGGGAIYIHASGSNQGHTHRGQVLGADAGVGSGAGATVGVDWLRRDGRWTASWSRVVRGRDDLGPPDPTRGLDAMDVLHTVGVERLLFAGSWDVTAGVTGGYDFNRERLGRDRRNLGLTLQLTRAVR